jgi:hypothetical protein
MVVTSSRCLGSGGADKVAAWVKTTENSARQSPLFGEGDPPSLLYGDLAAGSVVSIDCVEQVVQTLTL